MIRQRSQLELAKKYDESKRKNIGLLQTDIDNLHTNHEAFLQFVNDEEKSLNSTRDGIIYKVQGMTEDKKMSYTKDTFNKTGSSKVRYLWQKFI